MLPSCSVRGSSQPSGLPALCWEFRGICDRNFLPAMRHFTTSKTLGAALAPIASRRRAHRRRQTPPTGAAMKLFAYEHPSGPVHEVEVTLGDTAHWRRLRRSNATTRSRRRRVDAFVAAPSRARSQVLQLKSKIEQAMRTSAQESNFRHPTPSTRRCPRDRVGSMAWRFTKDI